MSPLPATPIRRFLLGLVVLAVVGTVGLFSWHAFEHWRSQKDRQEGLRLAELGRFDEAQPRLLAALQRHADDREVLKNLAWGYQAAGDFPKAEEFLTRWCALAPNDPEALQKRMDFWRTRKRHALAIHDGQRLLELDPKNLPVRQRVAEMLLMVGRYEEAEQECLRYLKQEPGNVEITYLLASTNRNQGKNIQAAALLDQVTRALPQSVPPVVLRAILYYEGGQPEQAIPLLRRALLQEPNHQQAGYYLGVCLARVGQTEEAQRLLSQIKYRESSSSAPE